MSPSLVLFLPFEEKLFLIVQLQIGSCAGLRRSQSPRGREEEPELDGNQEVGGPGGGSGMALNEFPGRDANLASADLPAQYSPAQNSFHSAGPCGAREVGGLGLDYSLSPAV